MPCSSRALREPPRRPRVPPWRHERGLHRVPLYSCNHDRPTAPIPTLGPSGACAATSCPVGAETSPEPSFRRPLHGCAVGSPRRPRISPKQGQKSSQGTPGPPRARSHPAKAVSLAGIAPAAPATARRDTLQGLESF
jgi:hypothetical protein